MSNIQDLADRSESHNRQIREQINQDKFNIRVTFLVALIILVGSIYAYTYKIGEPYMAFLGSIISVLLTILSGNAQRLFGEQKGRAEGRAEAIEAKQKENLAKPNDF